MSNPNFPHSPSQFEQEPQTISWPDIPSTIEAAVEYQEKMESLLKQNGWDEEEAYQVGYAFQELLKNAIVHGSLGLKKASGEQEEDWSKKVAAASALPEHKSKTVAVTVSITPRKITVTIQDPGANSTKFWEKETAGLRTGADTQWKSGRGVEISEAFLNQVRYEKNNTGVKTTFIRDLDSPIARKP